MTSRDTRTDDNGDVIFRPATSDDIPGILAMQEPAAIAGLSNIFPQDTHPFPRDVLFQRWSDEMADPAINVYVCTDADGVVTGFAATRGAELFHFGTGVEHWGTGLAAELHDYVIDALRSTTPPETDHFHLRVFEENRRARRFYEKLGWRSTGERSRTTFEPHPVLVGYELQIVPTVASPILTDGAITLRCLSVDEADAHVAGEDDDIRRWLSGGRSTVDGARVWIKDNQEQWQASGSRRNFGIYDGDGRLVGNAEANLALAELNPGEANISYAVFPKHRGQGFAARAVELICAWLAQHTAAMTAVIQVDEDNVRSAAVPMASGFRENGTVTHADSTPRRRFERSLQQGER